MTSSGERFERSAFALDIRTATPGHDPKVSYASSAVSCERLYYRAKEVAGMLGLSLRTIYEGIDGGLIPSRKIGNSRLIPDCLATPRPTTKWNKSRRKLRTIFDSIGETQTLKAE